MQMLPAPQHSGPLNFRYNHDIIAMMHHLELYQVRLIIQVVKRGHLADSDPEASRGFAFQGDGVTLYVQRQTDPMSAWAEEHGVGPSQAQMSNLSLGANGQTPSSWVSDYLGRADPVASPSGLGSQWAEQYTNARPQSERWADEYASSTGQVLCRAIQLYILI